MKDLRVLAYNSSTDLTFTVVPLSSSQETWTFIDTQDFE